jgi:hypothetical protein
MASVVDAVNPLHYSVFGICLPKECCSKD